VLPPAPPLRPAALPWMGSGKIAVISPNSRGNRGRGIVEPLGATFSWLLLSFESRGRLQRRLHNRSRCKNNRLAGLQLEPLMEPEPEPCQTGPKSQDQFKVVGGNQQGLRLAPHRAT
jgi:hypothetical protein